MHDSHRNVTGERGLSGSRVRRVKKDRSIDRFLEVKTHGLTSKPLTRSPVRDPKVRPTRPHGRRPPPPPCFDALVCCGPIHTSGPPIHTTRTSTSWGRSEGVDEEGAKQGKRGVRFGQAAKRFAVGQGARRMHGAASGHFPPFSPRFSSDRKGQNRFHFRRR